MKQVTIGSRTVVVRGDMHRVLASMPDSSVHLIFTDPPYGHDNNYDDLTSRREAALGQGNDALGEKRPINNDDYETANALFTTLRKAAVRVLVPGGTLCVCCGGGGGAEDIQLARWSLKLQRTAGLVFKQIVTWDKGPIGMGWHYRRSVEVVLVASKKGAKPLWFDTTRAVENIIRPGAYGISKIIPAKGQHPTEKPPELAGLFIALHTAPGMVVVDPFMGSGSTGVAAVQAKRKFIGVEMDPRWFAAARKRLTRCVETAGVDPGTTPEAKVARLTPLWGKGDQ